MVTADLNESLMVGQTATTLICDISGAEKLNQTITYQWTRNNGITRTTVIAGTSLSALTLPPLTLSHAGSYSCTMISALLNNPVTANNNKSVIIQSKSSSLL